MRFGSVCSGIEAASVASAPLGWEPVFFSEIDRFPCAVLAHHYPDVPNYGDMTQFKEWPDAAIDVLVGGTPCQSFSVAGLRKGLDDPRGNLALTYLAIAERYRPRWLVWENVPGVLSSGGGRDFGAFLGALGQLGYGFAYRVLDAQHFGLAQRRKRVFVVGYLGDWRPAAAVLFERESLQGHLAPSREAGEVAPTIPARSTAGGGLGTDDRDVGLISSTGELAHCLNAGGMGRQDYETETMVAFKSNMSMQEWADDGTCGTLQAGNQHAAAFAENSRGELRLEGGKGERCGSLSTGGGKLGQGAPMVATAFDARQNDVIQYGDKTGPLDTDGSSIGVQPSPMVVRRLTPTECEILQGFPRGYLDITYRGKPAADGPKYKALGNSWAVPVVRWIFRRVTMMNGIAQELEEAE